MHVCSLPHSILFVLFTLVSTGSVSAGIIPSQFLASGSLIKFIVYTDTNLLPNHFSDIPSVLFSEQVFSPLLLSPPHFAMWSKWNFPHLQLGFLFA